MTMYFCKKCNKGFEKVASIAAHSIIHTKTIKCIICNKKFLCSNIKRHVQSHKNDRFCLLCGKEVIHGNKFCNHSCATSYCNKIRGLKERPFYKCLGCNKEIKIGEFCSVLCKKEFKYKRYIEEWLLGLKSGNSGDQINGYVKKWLRERAKDSCEGLLDNNERCGWARINKHTGRSPLCAHHKNGNSKNTVPNNLELLCPSCHSLTENYGSRNKGNGRENRTKWRKNKKRVSPIGMASAFQAEPGEFDSPNPHFIKEIP